MARSRTKKRLGILAALALISGAWLGEPRARAQEIESIPADIAAPVLPGINVSSLPDLIMPQAEPSANAELDIPISRARAASPIPKAAADAAVLLRRARRSHGARLKAQAGRMFDEEPASGFPASARISYKGHLVLGHKIVLSEKHLSDMTNRIGLNDAAILRFVGRERQFGKTCARHALAVCAEANGRSDGALLFKVMEASKRAKLSLLGESLRRQETARAEIVKTGGDPAAADERIKEMKSRSLLIYHFPEKTGLTHKETALTAEEAGLEYRAIGHVGRDALRAIKPGGDPALFQSFLRDSAEFKGKIDAELAHGDAVMASLYTGAAKNGDSGHHAVAVLGKGTKPSGISYYIVYDSNIGRPMLYRADKFFVYAAAVAR
ncbi:MAG: hypothetical protein ACYCPQ_02305 [Elusimicrobiota bacterium]